MGHLIFKMREQGRMLIFKMREQGRVLRGYQLRRAGAVIQVRSVSSRAGLEPDCDAGLLWSLWAPVEDREQHQNKGFAAKTTSGWVGPSKVIWQGSILNMARCQRVCGVRVRYVMGRVSLGGAPGQTRPECVYVHSHTTGSLTS